MAVAWYIETQERTLGPFTGSQLKELAASGRLGPDDLVRRGDHPKRVRAADVRGLFQKPNDGFIHSVPAASQDVEPSPVEASKGRPDGVNEGLKRLSRASKAAAGLAAAQTRKVHMERVVLPSAYGALGLEIYTSGRFRDAFPQLYDEVDDAERRIEQLTSQRPQARSARSLGDRAADAAVGATAAAQARILSMKQESLVRRLGESCYGRYRDASGPGRLVRPIAEALSTIESLDGETSRLAGIGQGAWVTPYRILGAFAVLGLVLLTLVSRNFRDESAFRPGQHREAAEAPTPEEMSTRSQAEDRLIPVPADADATAAFFRDYPESTSSGEYMGKHLIVSGGRVSLAELDGGVCQLHLQTTFRGVAALCKFPPSNSKGVWSWKDPTYTVEGTFNGSPRDGFIELADCRLIARAGPAGHDEDASLPSIEQFLTMMSRAGEVKNPRKGLPILMASRYELRATLGEPTNVVSSERDRKGTHEVLDYACSDGRVLLSVTYDMAGAWIEEVAVRRVR